MAAMAIQFASLGGFYLKNDYFNKEYLAAKRACASSKSTNKKTITGLAIAGDFSMAAADMLDIIQYQPLAILVNAESCVLSYKSGVITSQNCVCNGLDSDGEPTVTDNFNIVGYSINTATPGCSGYWIVKTSFGTAWGD